MLRPGWPTLGKRSTVLHEPDERYIPTKQIIGYLYDGKVRVHRAHPAQR